MFVLNKNIIIFMGESYLKYEGGFVDVTSYLWWDPKRKKSFGACVSNFMAH